MMFIRHQNVVLACSKQAIIKGGWHGWKTSAQTKEHIIYRRCDYDLMRTEPRLMLNT